MSSIVHSQWPQQEQGLDALTAKADALATMVETSQFLFAAYAHQYQSMECSRFFIRGDLSGQCQALLGNVESLSRDREEVKRVKIELKRELDDWRNTHFHLLNEEEQARIQHIEEALKQTDDLDKKDAPPKEYDLYINEERRWRIVLTPDVCADREANPLWCKLRWMICFPCSLLAAPCLNRYVCGANRIEWLKNGLKKGIRT